MKIRTKDGRFSESFKIHVVEEVEAGRLSQAAAMRKYDILGHSTIQKWCRKYGRLRGSTGRRRQMAKQDYETMRLENEIKALKQELDDARFKNVVLETLVDVAEKELGIPIRKKHGAKRSAK
ncbi:MAG: helix-turn-helix domain-containing protein [Chitinivibrionales bacterium]|nr:helix-turn-helix domain-containing protein [Chitinivibrionales bacterium]